MYIYKNKTRGTTMRIKKLINIILISLCIFLIAGVGTFVYYAKSAYKISSDFVSVPLKFNHTNCSSTYKLKDAKVTVYGGFVKGFRNGKNNTKSLVIRALSPLPTLKLEGTKATDVSLIIENVNPDLYAQSIRGSKLHMEKVAVNTLQLNAHLSSGEVKSVEPIKKAHRIM